MFIGRREFEENYLAQNGRIQAGRLWQVKEIIDLRENQLR